MRVVQIGYGAVGRENIRQLSKRGYELVGIVDRDDVLARIDSADLLGYKPVLRQDLGECLRESKAQLVLQATPFDPDDMLRAITQAAKAKCDVVSINPIVDIRAVFPDLYATLNRIAEEGGIRVLGVGIIPGFFSDVFPLVMSGLCADVTTVRFRRRADFSKWGPSVLERFGFGRSADEFHKGASAGTITLFRALWQSAHLIAHELRWPVTETSEYKEPLVSTRVRKADEMTVQAGTVGGFSHRVVIHSEGGRSIDIEVVGYVGPEGADEVPTMFVEIVGEPSMRIDVGGDVMSSAGAKVASSARMINSIASLANAAPGIRTTAELPEVACR